MARIVIGVQLVIAGFQLPAKFIWIRWREMALLLLPVMTTMWLCTAGSILLIVPKLTWVSGRPCCGINWTPVNSIQLSALVIGSCVTCTDPILSQAIAKGPFADKYVARGLREIISAEAGANDGFGFPFLMLATYLMRHAFVPEGSELNQVSGEIGRLGGGAAKAMENWFVETWFYFVLLSVVYGAVLGYGSCRLLQVCLRRYVASRHLLSCSDHKLTFCRRWIDNESYLLFPTALGVRTFVSARRGA